MCRNLIAAIAAFMLMALASPASAGNYSLDRKNILSYEELKQVPQHGGYYYLWWQPHPDEKFWSAHCELVANDPTDVTEVDLCVDKHRAYDENDLDKVQTHRWYWVIMNPEQFRNLLLRLHGEGRLDDKPKWHERALERVTDTIKTLQDRIDGYGDRVSANEEVNDRQNAAIAELAEQQDDLRARLDDGFDRIDRTVTELTEELDEARGERRRLANELGDSSVETSFVEWVQEAFNSTNEAIMRTFRSVGYGITIYWPVVLVLLWLLAFAWWLAKRLGRRRARQGDNTAPAATESSGPKQVEVRLSPEPPPYQEALVVVDGTERDRLKLSESRKSVDGSRMYKTPYTPNVREQGLAHHLQESWLKRHATI